MIDELKSWKSHRILTALVITSRSCKDFFASEPDFYNGIKGLQSHIQNWELYQEVNHSKAYKDLKPEVDKLGKTASLPEKAISNLKNAKSLAKELSQEIKYSDSTTSAKALINAVEEARNGLEKAATSIYKAKGKRNNTIPEPNDTSMPDYDNVGPSPPHDFDCTINGYYFIILDNLALEKFLGSTFFHLCKVMKEVETAKDKNLARAEEYAKDYEYPCPEPGCIKGHIPDKRKGCLDIHTKDKHPGYGLDVKRRKMGSGSVGRGGRDGSVDDGDVEMAVVG